MICRKNCSSFSYCFILCFLDNLIVTMREGGFDPWMSPLETPKATN